MNPLMFYSLSISKHPEASCNLSRAICLIFQEQFWRMLSNKGSHLWLLKFIWRGEDKSHILVHKSFVDKQSWRKYYHGMQPEPHNRRRMANDVAIIHAPSSLNVSLPKSGNTNLTKEEVCHLDWLLWITFLSRGAI